MLGCISLSIFVAVLHGGDDYRITLLVLVVPSV